MAIISVMRSILIGNYWFLPSGFIQISTWLDFFPVFFDWFVVHFSVLIVVGHQLKMTALKSKEEMKIIMIRLNLKTETNIFTVFAGLTKVQPHMVSKKDGLIARFGFLFPKKVVKLLLQVWLNSNLIWYPKGRTGGLIAPSAAPSTLQLSPLGQ